MVLRNFCGRYLSTGWACRSRGHILIAGYRLCPRALSMEHPCHGIHL